MDLVRQKPLAFRLRELGPKLLALRNAAELSQKAVYDLVRVDPSTLTAIENGQRTPQHRTLVALLDCYGVRGAERERLLALIRPVKAPEWLHAYDAAGLTGALRDLTVLESYARTIRNYPGQFLPGLCHTGDYAASALAGAFPRLDRAQIDQLVEVRMRRQQALAGPVVLSAVIDEGALWRVVGGPEIMRAQLRHLLAQPPNVTIKVIPFSAGAHTGMSGGFTLMEFRDPAFAPVVYIDSMDGDMLREEPERVALFAEMFAALDAETLSVSESAELIASVAERIEG